MLAITINKSKNNNNNNNNNDDKDNNSDCNNFKLHMVLICK